MKKSFLAWAFLAVMFSVTACNTATTEEKTAIEVTEAPATAASADSTTTSVAQMAYICPMKCEGSASMEPGKCPECKMNLEKNPAYTAQ